MSETKTERVDAKPAKKPVSLVPIKLLRDYRPGGKFRVWTILERDEDGRAVKYGKRDPIGEPDTPSEFTNNQGRTFPITIPANGEYAKVRAGRIIDVPKKEANRILKLRIGEKPLESYEDDE